MKTCFKCGQTKRSCEFYRHSKMGDGLLGKCMECTKRDVREHRRTHESVREYDRRRYRDNKERRLKGAENAARWKVQHPDGYRAHYLVGNAIRDGRLKREPCANCGTTKLVNAHHDDYSRPLDVHWLCATCHHRYHAAHR